MVLLYINFLFVQFSEAHFFLHPYFNWFISFNMCKTKWQNRVRAGVYTQHIHIRASRFAIHMLDITPLLLFFFLLQYKAMDANGTAHDFL